MQPSCSTGQDHESAFYPSKKVCLILRIFYKFNHKSSRPDLIRFWTCAKWQIIIFEASFSLEKFSELFIYKPKDFIIFEHQQHTDHCTVIDHRLLLFKVSIHVSLNSVGRILLFCQFPPSDLYRRNQKCALILLTMT